MQNISLNTKSDSNDSFVVTNVAPVRRKASAAVTKGQSVQIDNAKLSTTIVTPAGHVAEQVKYVKPGAAVTAGNFNVVGVAAADAASGDEFDLIPCEIGAEVPYLITVTGVAEGDLLVPGGTAGTWIKYASGTHTNIAFCRAIRAAAASAETSSGSGVYVTSGVWVK